MVMKHQPKDCSSYTANLAWLQSSTREPWWLLCFKSVFLEMSIVTIWSVFPNPVTYVKNLSFVINNSHILGYADDTKRYKHMVMQFDQQLLQDDLNSSLHWNKSVDLSFNPNKCVHICINPKIIQSYFLGENIIPTRSIQSDLGVVICDNLITLE